MAPFRLHRDAQDWFFKDLYSSKSFKIGFDAFYFCFIAGISIDRKEYCPQSETEELVDYFPEKYAGRGNLLISLFLTRELEKLGVTMSDKKEVHSTIAHLVSLDARNHLSTEGVHEFNKYAHAGFEMLREWFNEDRPRSLETFLRTFKLKVDKVLEGR
ncbi:MAG: hypothetical protein F4Z81_10915 [Gemmatimonadetes bacterium]|nr:hypothetical protein [Gemmatimonadota bacterium]MYB62290.1 hypothetical protein [Gemmatimonadota bacterium]